MFLNFSKQAQFATAICTFLATMGIFVQNQIEKKHQISIIGEKVYTKNQVFTGMTKPSQRQIGKNRFLTPGTYKSDERNDSTAQLFTHDF